MDTILSDFIGRTNADPALAHDLLDATEWNIDAALAAYESLHDTHTTDVPDFHYDPSDFEKSSLSNIPEHGDYSGDVEDSVVEGSVSGVEVDVNEARRRQLAKKQREKRGRGLSLVAGEIVDKFNKVAISKQKVQAKEQVTIDDKFFQHSFVYPDLSSESDDLQEYIASDLLEISHKRALETSGRLNWWTTTGKLPRLEPLSTSGDGNCLLHAASLYMWGFHDRELILRTALHRLLTSGIEKDGIRRRWQYQTQLRNNEAGGLRFSDEEWEFEWGEIIRIATNKPRRQPVTASLRRYSSLRLSYESLEEIHVFALAHVIRRAVIIISNNVLKDYSGQDLAPIYFGGIYLPLEVNPTACYKSPLVLAYDSAHFSPLVAREDLKQEQQQQTRVKYARGSSRKETVIPLVTPDGSLLPVQFIFDPKKKDVKEKWAKMEYPVGEFPDDIIRLLESYMDIRWIQLKVSSVQQSIGSTDEDYDHLFPVQVPKVRFPAASITQEAQPIYQKELIDKYLESIRKQYEEEREERLRREEERKKKLDNLPVPCEGEGCDLFGRVATNNLCSMCHQKQLSKKTKRESASPDHIEKDSSVPDGRHRPPPPYPPPKYRYPSPDPADTHRDLPNQVSPTVSPQSSIQPSNQTFPKQKATQTVTSDISPKHSPNHPPTLPPKTTTHTASNAASSPPVKSPVKSSTNPTLAPSGKKFNASSLVPPLFKKKYPVAQNTSGGGYTRDNIQPIKFKSTVGREREAGTKTVCRRESCEFFGNAETDGLCSKCFAESQQIV